MIPVVGSASDPELELDVELGFGLELEVDTTGFDPLVPESELEPEPVLEFELEFVLGDGFVMMPVFGSACDVLPLELEPLEPEPLELEPLEPEPLEPEPLEPEPLDPELELEPEFSGLEVDIPVRGSTAPPAEDDETCRTFNLPPPLDVEFDTGGSYTSTVNLLTP